MSNTKTVLTCADLIARYCPDLPQPAPATEFAPLVRERDDGTLVLAPFAINKLQSLLKQDPYRGLGVFDTLEITVDSDPEGTGHDAWITGHIGGFRISHGYWLFEGSASAGKDEHLRLPFRLPGQVGRFIKKIVKSELEQLGYAQERVSIPTADD